MHSLRSESTQPPLGDARGVLGSDGGSRVLRVRWRRYARLDIAICMPHREGELAIGESAWESNPPAPLCVTHSSFEDREAHRDLCTPTERIREGATGVKSGGCSPACTVPRIAIIPRVLPWPRAHFL